MIPDAKPWYRRAWAFATHAHKALIAFASICATTIGAHAWIAGLVTKENVRAEVTGAVAAAMVETRVQVTALNDRTAGLPEWRKATHELVIRHEERLNAVEKLANKTDDRIDRYLQRSPR